MGVARTMRCIGRCRLMPTRQSRRSKPASTCSTLRGGTLMSVAPVGMFCITSMICIFMMVCLPSTKWGAGVGLGTKQAALDGRCGMRAEWEGTGTHHRLSAHQPRPAPPRPRVRSHLEPCRERQRKRGQWERRRDASRAASARCDGSMASAAVRRAARTHQCQKRRLRKAEWISFTADAHAKPHGFVEKFGFVRADPLRYQSYRLQCGLARGHFVGYFGGHNYRSGVGVRA